MKARGAFHLIRDSLKQLAKNSVAVESSCRLSPRPERSAGVPAVFQHFVQPAKKLKYSRWEGGRYLERFASSYTCTGTKRLLPIVLNMLRTTVVVHVLELVCIWRYLMHALWAFVGSCFPRVLTLASFCWMFYCVLLC